MSSAGVSKLSNRGYSVALREVSEEPDLPKATSETLPVRENVRLLLDRGGGLERLFALEGASLLDALCGPWSSDEVRFPRRETRVSFSAAALPSLIVGVVIEDARTIEAAEVRLFALDGILSGDGVALDDTRSVSRIAFWSLLGEERSRELEPVASVICRMRWDGVTGFELIARFESFLEGEERVPDWGLSKRSSLGSQSLVASYGRGPVALSFVEVALLSGPEDELLAREGVLLLVMSEMGGISESIKFCFVTR